MRLYSANPLHQLRVSNKRGESANIIHLSHAGLGLNHFTLFVKKYFNTHHDH